MAGHVQITVFLLPFHHQLKTLHRHSSVESLMVETVLESFDFLNADCSADELSLFGSVRTGSVRYVLQHLWDRHRGSHNATLGWETAVLSNPAQNISLCV